MDRFHLINVFVAVVDTNGFGGAERKLNMSPPAVTRAINELETHLGLRLLTRTTRTVRVTDAGERYVQDCRRILAEMLEADESESGMHTSPRGRLTVTAPVLFGGMYVTPIVTQYLTRYPEVSASCLFLDRVVNLLDEGVDVAVRIGELPDSTLQARRWGGEVTHNWFNRFRKLLVRYEKLERSFLALNQLRSFVDGIRTPLGWGSRCALFDCASDKFKLLLRKRPNHARGVWPFGV